MVDTSKSFEVSEDGITVGSDVVWFGGGTAVPTFSAPINSYYYRTDKTIYIQRGPGPSDWDLYDAENLIFDNTSTTFVATNAQDAIEEAKASGDLAKELPRYPASSVHNGTISNGQLIGVSNLVNNPIIVPIKSTLAEVTYYQGGGSSRDGQYRFYRNTETAPNLFFTWSLPNTESDVAEGFGVDFSSPTFNQGDTLQVYFDDIGQNAQDLTMIYYFQAVE